MSNHVRRIDLSQLTFRISTRSLTSKLQPNSARTSIDSNFKLIPNQLVNSKDLEPQTDRAHHFKDKVLFEAIRSKTPTSVKTTVYTGSRTARYYNSSSQEELTLLTDVLKRGKDCNQEERESPSKMPIMPNMSTPLARSHFQKIDFNGAKYSKNEKEGQSLSASIEKELRRFQNREGLISAETNKRAQRKMKINIEPSFFEKLADNIDSKISSRVLTNHIHKDSVQEEAINIVNVGALIIPKQRPTSRPQTQSLSRFSRPGTRIGIETGRSFMRQKSIQINERSTYLKNHNIDTSAQPQYNVSDIQRVLSKKHVHKKSSEPVLQTLQCYVDIKNQITSDVLKQPHLSLFQTFTNRKIESLRLGNIETIKNICKGKVLMKRPT